MIEGDASADAVFGNGFAPNAVIDITINGMLFDNVAMTDGGGSFGTNWEQFGVGLVLGDTIVVSDGTSTKDLTLDGPLSIDLDAVGLSASGVAPAGGMITVFAGGDACDSTTGVVVDNTGTWTVDLSIDCPGGLGSSTWGQVNLDDGDGDASMAGDPVPMCNGQVVTVDVSRGESPTEGDDVIRGTSGPDDIDSLGGNDTICSLQGNDTIDAGDGFDKVFAGQGADSIIGGAGNDKLVGGAGNDTIMGGNGNDRLQGGDGADMVNGDGGLDRVAGGNGNDILRGGSHADELLGGLGRDDLFGDGGNDVLRGGAWIDTFDGGAGTDGCTLTDPSGNIEVRISCETGVFGL